VVFYEPGSSGEDQTWDFRTLKLIDDAYVVHYFTRDDWKIIGAENGKLSFLRVHGDSLWIGGYETSSHLVKYHQQGLLLRFPLAYGVDSQGRYAGRGKHHDRLESTVTGEIHTIADATGSVILPGNDTLSSVIRVHIRKVEHLRHLPISSEFTIDRPANDSLFAAIEPEILTTDTYQWYEEGYRYPVFETIETYREGSPERLLLSRDAYFYHPAEQAYLPEDAANQVVLERKQTARRIKMIEKESVILSFTYTNGTSVYFDDIQYYDGLGRPVETVQKQYTPTSKDLVGRTEYDGYGREYKQWLPAPNTKSDGTYNGVSASFYGDTYPYSETVYEQSPLNRVQNQYGPGVNWRNAGRKVTIEYMANKSGDAALNCPNFSSTAAGSFIKSTDYATGLVYVTKTTDEDGYVSYEFKDKLGKLLLQRRMDGSIKYDTNYVYDTAGNLVYVLPPNVSDALTGAQTYNYWATYNSIYLPNYVYSYTYDERNRKADVVIPGVDVENLIYDSADRLVMDQTPAIQIPNGKGGRGWLFNKYDVFGRVILSGIYTGDDAGAKDANGRAYDMKVKYKTILSKESVSSSANDYHYTWNTFPALSQTEVTHVNFYDNYTYATDNADNSGSLVYLAKAGYGTQYSSAQGLLTGSWDKLSDGSGWIKTAYYYDAFGNLVQKRSTNNKSGYDYEYYLYNANNQATKKYTEHAALGQSQITEEYTYSYDARLRLTTVNYKFNGGAGVDIAAYQYDDVGRMKEKKTGDGTEIASFKYNVRSWETEQAGQRFSENLYYESGNPKSGGSLYYGGNLSAWTWKAEPSMTTIRGYSFKYNAMGWLTDAVYGESANLSTGTLRYDEYFTYNTDKLGNIKTLKRYGLKDNGAYGLIDDVNVTEYYGNMVRKVTDAAGNQSSSDVMEFKYNSDPVNDVHYSYYSSGALMNDYHRRICMIKYNYLSLPQSVQFRRGDRIEYVYDASGEKRQVTRKVSNRDLNYAYWSQSVPATTDFDASKTVTTNYFGNKVYVNNQLKYVLTEEGYIEKTTGSTTFTPYYYLDDHLGSHRIVMDANGTVKQVNSYYPSGTSMAERRTDQGVQPYKFGGKELDRTNTMDSYDFEARTYDPTLMRFTRTDPMAEKYYSTSPFAYAGNNPVSNVDPTGLTDYKINENGYIYDNSSLWDKIKRIFTGPDKTDKLIASNGNTLTMKAGTMTDFVDMKNNEGVTVGQSFKIESSDIAEQVHEFLSENLKKEYGVVNDIKNGIIANTITTSFKENGNDAATIAQNLLQSGANILRITHNHPSGTIQSPSPDDKSAVQHFNTHFPQNYIEWRIYNPEAKKYIYYNENGIIKTVPKKQY